MTRISPLLFALIAIFFVASQCEAETYYVSTNGYDSRSTHTASHRKYPWRTIQHGVNQARAGDQIVVLDGTYYEEVYFNRSGYQGAEIILRSENREGAKVVGSIGGNDVSYIRVDGFDVTNRRLNAIQDKGITCLLYTSPSPRDGLLSRMPSSA